ncbi:MAG: HEPN domain-containing protein [Tannerellaceae bacterium]|jgi:uncharacterized protein (UPF0332 family)|nr:HEPN domain-containing protein [Tannerellaceae bacterium]
MSLEEQDRKEIVRFRMDKARATFAEVPVLMEHRFYRTAANRLYYACFYAATALLIGDGCETHTHSGVITLLGMHYISKGRIDRSFGKMYRQLFNLRQTGDYEDCFDVDEEDVRQHIEPVGNFIALVEKLTAQ